MKILRCIDQRGWAYDFLTQEYMRYSKYGHEIRIAKHDEVMQHIDWADIVYIHSPDITTWHAIQLPQIAHAKGKKVITQYSGNPAFWSEHEKPVYSYSDLVVTISPQLYQFAKHNYPDTPVIYLPESVDTQYFTPSNKPINDFKIGWAGGFHKKVKRGYLLEQLNYPVQIQDTWKQNRKAADNGENTNLDSMRDFYRSISCLVVTSSTECMPRVVMEAAACGLSVVGTDVGSMRLLLDSKFIVPSTPDEDVVNGLNSILKILKEDKCYRNYIGKRNRLKTLHNFSWEVNTYLWDLMYKSVYNNKTGCIVYEAEHWLDKFRYEFNSTITTGTEKSNTLSDMEVKDIILFLNNHNEDYYLSQTSCLDCVRYQELKLEKNTLYLGCYDKPKIEGLLIGCGFKLEDNKLVRKNVTVILENATIQHTKEMPFYNMSIKVPYPVVGYLKSLYGEEWDKK